MAFFARPNLDNTQFKQLQGGEPLTLSGQTQIATTSGLTLATDNIGNGVIITASGASSATNNYVLTYDDVQKGIILKEATASGGTGYYTGRIPTTCTVGGLSANTNINTWTINSVLECALAPVVNPTLTNPSISSFTISDNTTIMEVGTSLSVTGSVVPNYGCIDSNYSGGTYRTCGVSGYTFDCFNAPGSFVSCPQTTEGSFATYSSSGIISAGNNNPVKVYVHFCNGGTPYNSTGGTYSTAYSATAYTANKLITGIYPWFWGVESGGVVPAGNNKPTGTCIKNIISTGTSSGTVCKVVGTTNGTLQIPFNSSPYDYIWFALPNGTTKTNWGTETDNGEIGGSVSVGGKLFPEPEEVFNVCTTCWNGQTYQIYVSNYQSSVSTIMEIN